MENIAVIYDLDGTLLYTLEDLKNSVNFALEKYNYPLRTVDEIRRFIGNGVNILMKRCEPAGTTEEMHTILLNIFREHYLKHMYDNTSPYDGILDMMKEIKEYGYKTAIVSNKLDPAVKELDNLFFKGYTDLAVGAPSEHKKPDPYSVNECLKELKCDTSHAIYIGDTDVDLETAHNSGLKCIGVTWGFRGREFLENINCDYIVDSPEEVLPLLNKIFNV